MARPPGGLDPELSAIFRDSGRFRRLHALVAATRRDPRPHLELLGDQRLAADGRLAVLPGSFNPLTAAHVALAEAAEQSGLGPVAYTLSTHTVDKERIEGALLEDRLLVLELHAARPPGRLVALVNRGLYVEQAELFRAALPDLLELTFLVGFDKIVQIFDPRYYEDREAALERLFGLASFAVAPRAGAGSDELAALLAQPANRRFGPGVRALLIGAELEDVSSSAIRATSAAGRPLPAVLPPESLAFIEATGCYSAGEGYRERRALLLGDA